MGYASEGEVPKDDKEAAAWLWKQKGTVELTQ